MVGAARGQPPGGVGAAGLLSVVRSDGIMRGGPIMQFPFTFVFEAPTRADLRDAARRPRLWALAVGLCLLVAGVIILARAHRAAQALPADAELAVTSTPADAAILIDGRDRGRTPATLILPRGHHRVTLRLAPYANVSYNVDLAPGHPATLDGL